MPSGFFIRKGVYMKISELEVDPKLIEEGKWVSHIPELTGVRLKVRGANNKDWRKFAQRLVNAVPRKKRVNGNLDPDEADRVSALILLHTGLLDWEGIEADDGTAIPYDKQKAAQYLAGERFRVGVQFACDQVAQGIEQEVEDIAGN
jgi:hypothetical protein